jgi:hypothetical protein
MRSVKLSEE